jgi:hypothetical protein
MGYQGTNPTRPHNTTRPLFLLAPDCCYLPPTAPLDRCPFRRSSSPQPDQLTTWPPLPQLLPLPQLVLLLPLLALLARPGALQTSLSAPWYSLPSWLVLVPS